jgi:hypothetical protein
MVVVRFRWERSFDRSYCRKNVGTDGNPFQNSKTYRYEFYGRLAFLERSSPQMQELLWQTAPDMTKAMFKPGSILESISHRSLNFLYHIRFQRRSQV